MLIPADGRLSGRRPARRAAAAAMAAAAAATLPLTVAASARADQVRQKQQWVLTAVNAPAAWRITRGHGVLVAVIDSGVDPTVSDLAGSVTPGRDYTGVGTPESNPDWGAHGTWMASLIAGHGHGHGGRSGILGVAPRARVLSVRVITDRADPGFRRYQQEPPARGQRELAAAIRYAVDHGASVISMSLGYTEPSLAVRAALQYAVNHNVVVIASAGNSGTAQIARGHGHAPYSFPADYPGVIGVAAVTATGAPANFSSGNLSVQVAAPGVNVPAQGRRSHYWLVSGTSPACALTAGVAALVRAGYPKLTAAQVRLAIIRSAAHHPRGGYSEDVGFGMVDAAAALAFAGRLAGQAPAGNSAAGRAAASGHFGTGQLPPVPVPPRSKDTLLELYGAAAASMALLIVSLWRFGAGLASRRAARRYRGAGPPSAIPGLVPGFAGAGVDPRYLPHGVAPGQFGPGYPGPAMPAQPWPAQQWPGQPSPAAPWAGPVPAGPGPSGQPPPGLVPSGPGPSGQPPPGLVPSGPGPSGQPPPGPPLPGQYRPGQYPQGSQPATQAMRPAPAMPPAQAMPPDPSAPPVPAPSASGRLRPGPPQPPAGEASPGPVGREVRTRPSQALVPPGAPKTAAGPLAASVTRPVAKPSTGLIRAAPVTQPDIPALGPSGQPLPKRVRPGPADAGTTPEPPAGADPAQPAAWDPWTPSTKGADAVDAPDDQADQQPT